MSKDHKTRALMGGTELAAKELFELLPRKYRKKFNFHVAKLSQMNDKPNILWVHDLPGDDMYDNIDLSKLAKIIFVSHWQQEKFTLAYKIPYSRGYVIQNAIHPIPIHKKVKSEKLQLIYCSTPHRGLNLLLDALDLLESQEYHLHIYSSFALYGWDDDKRFQNLFDRCRQHPNITYYGAVDYATLRKAWQEMHILAYPSTWSETSCRVAMEAMSSGCALVTSSLAALPETTTEFAYTYPYTEIPKDHIKRFALQLNEVMANYWSLPVQKNLKEQVNYSHNHHSWENRIRTWIKLLDSI